MTKILIIRFSSIGDIVLTSPLIRCVKQQLPDAEIHFLTKRQFIPVLQSNPYLSHIHLFKDNFQELIPKLRAENFDLIIDLHKNFRSFYLRFTLQKPFVSFPKLNVKKWLLTRFHINLLPDIHIVDRYFHSVRSLGIHNDGMGLDYFLLESESVPVSEKFPSVSGKFLVIVIGGKHNTKIFPPHKVAQLCNNLSLPVILLGGKEDIGRGDLIVNSTKHLVINACGMFPLNGSASVIRQAETVITNDTGLMHISAAFHKPVISLWGSTIPGFGMSPYFPQGLEQLSTLVEVTGLRCRPCSKLGYRKCPKRHFNCMEKIDQRAILSAL